MSWLSWTCWSGSTTIWPVRPTRLSNRIRGLLTGIYPALERPIGPRIADPAVLEILPRCSGPVGIAQAGRRKLTARSRHPPLSLGCVGGVYTGAGPSRSDPRRLRVSAAVDNAGSRTVLTRVGFVPTGEEVVLAGRPDIVTC